MTHRRSLWLPISCLLLAGVACAETVDGACELDQDCPEGQVCASNQRCANKSTYRPPNPNPEDGGVPIIVTRPDAGGLPGTDAGSNPPSDGGTSMLMRPPGLVPSGNPEWTIILDGNTWVLTEFSEFMKQQDMGSCYFIGYNLNLARSDGPVSGGADGPTQGHSGWSQWYGTMNYEFSSQCSPAYSAELTLGSVTYSLSGTLLKALNRGGAGSGGPSVDGTWSDGMRNGSFELYDYVR